MINERVVQLFLLKSLREAKRKVRVCKEYDSITLSDYAMAELALHNLYHAFLENLHRKYKIPAFHTAASFDKAKTFFDE